MSERVPLEQRLDAYDRLKREVQTISDSYQNPDIKLKKRSVHHPIPYADCLAYMILGLPHEIPEDVAERLLGVFGEDFSSIKYNNDPFEEGQVLYVEKNYFFRRRRRIADDYTHREDSISPAKKVEVAVEQRQKPKSDVLIGTISFFLLVFVSFLFVRHIKTNSPRLTILAGICLQKIALYNPLKNIRMGAS